MSDDPVEHPRHYTSHPANIECIDVVEHMGFNLGNAVKNRKNSERYSTSLEGYSTP
jgi:hypothetical protein